LGSSLSRASGAPALTPGHCADRAIPRDRPLAFEGTGDEAEVTRTRVTDAVGVRGEPDPG